MASGWEPFETWMDTVGAGIYPSQTGEKITPERALRLAAVHACVKVISEGCMVLPLKVFRRLPNGDSEPAKDLPLYPLLHSLPMPNLTSCELIEGQVANMGFAGRAYAQILRRGDGQIVGLNPVHPGRVRERRRGLETLYDVTMADGSTATLSQWEMWATRNWLGLSPLELAAEAIGLGVAAEAYGARFFANDATPGGVIEHPKQLGTKGAKNLMESWALAHSGPNSHRPTVLEEGATWKSVAIPAKDAQLLDSRYFQVEEIARIFRVPLHLIGDLRRATFSNIEHQDLEFVKYTLSPWLVRIEQSANRDLLTPAERERYFVAFSVDGFLRGDQKTRYGAYAIGLQNGFLNVNEVRRLENANGIGPAGDVYRSPLNMAPSSVPSSEPGDEPDA